MKQNFALLVLITAIASGPGAKAAAPTDPNAKFLKSVQMAVAVNKPSEIPAREKGVAAAYGIGVNIHVREQKIEARVKFTNSEYSQNFENYTAVVSVLGTSVKDRRLRKALIQQTIPINVAPRKTIEASLPVISMTYQAGTPNGVFDFGYCYEGWIAIIKDPSNKVIFCKTSSHAAWEKMPEKLASIQNEKVYNANLDVVDDPDAFPRR
jgi:hypothetical protein